MPTDTIYKAICMVMRAVYPAPQSHADVWDKLSWLAGKHRIAMCMNELATSRKQILTIDPDYLRSTEKKYRLA